MGDWTMKVFRKLRDFIDLCCAERGRKRKEWYRKKIAEADKREDFVRADYLEAEMDRWYG